MHEALSNGICKFGCGCRMSPTDGLFRTTSSDNLQDSCCLSRHREHLHEAVAGGFCKHGCGHKLSEKDGRFYQLPANVVEETCSCFGPCFRRVYPDPSVAQRSEQTFFKCLLDLPKGFARRLRERFCPKDYQRFDYNDDFMDNAVNAQALICALVLTLPYALLSSLDMDFWDKVEVLSQNCTEVEFAQYTTFRQTAILSSLSTIYAACGSLILATFYYLLKPKDFDGMKRWWAQGRLFTIVMFSMTCLAVISLVTFTNTYVSSYVLKSSDFCTPGVFSPYYKASIAFLCIVLFVGFCLFL